MTASFDQLLSKDDMQEFASKLREARLARNLTQARLAELVEVDTRVYHRWERGGAMPQIEALIRLSKVLQISVDELLGLKPTLAEPTILNPRLAAMMQQINALSDEDQQALLVVMDSLLKRAEMTKLLTNLSAQYGTPKT